MLTIRVSHPARAIATALLASAALSFVTPHDAAAQVTVGTAADGSALCIPFGCGFAQTRYQQVYAASAFLTPMTIGSLTFHHTQASPGAGLFADVTFDLYLTTTSRAVGALSPEFDENLAAPAQLFAHATLTGSAAAPSFTITGTPFVYDPSRGNLLADIRISSLGTLPSFDETFFDADYSGALMSSIYDYSYGPGAEGISAGPEALVTTFGSATTTTPEPATLVLAASGLLALGTFARRRTS
jgi:hypothetical protein